MVLKNMKAFIAATIQLLSTETSLQKTIIPALGLTGNTFYLANSGWGITSNRSNSIQIAPMSISASRGIYLGTGNTAVTENDYTLASPITSGLSASAPSGSVAYNNGNPYLNQTYLLTNSTDSDITIREMCEVANMRCGEAPDTSTNSAVPAMIWREVLSTPVTVPANGSAVLTVKRQVNLS